jgi:TolB-like protein
MKNLRLNHNLPFLGFLFLAINIACAPGPNVYFRPKTDFRPSKTLAILPFVNLSGQDGAGKQVSNAFLIELLKKPFISVVEPGEVDRILREERVRSADQIDFNTSKLLGNKLRADYLLLGTVNEFEYATVGTRQIPKVSISARLLEASTGQIVWAVYQNRKGDDTELIFGWGFVNSLPKLTMLSAKSV